VTGFGFVNHSEISFDECRVSAIGCRVVLLHAAYNGYIGCTSLGAQHELIVFSKSSARQ
jgi:hypothetical protein